MKISSYIILDFETGGLNSKAIEKSCKEFAITELAMLSIKGDTLEEITRAEILFKPYDDNLIYSVEAERVTGITKDLLMKEGLEWNECKKEVERALSDSMLYSHYHKSYLVAHNNGFDRNFFMEMCNRMKIDLKKYVRGDVDVYGNFQPHFIDTLDIGRMAFGDNEMIPDFKLGTIVEFFGQQQADGHRAMADVIPTKDVLVESIKRLRREEGAEMVGGELKYKKRASFQF